MNQTFCIKSNGQRTVIGTVDHFKALARPDPGNPHGAPYPETGWVDCGPAVEAKTWLLAKDRYDRMGLTRGLANS